MLRWLHENAWAHIDFDPPPSFRRKTGAILLAGFAAIGFFLAWRSGLGLESRGARIAWGVGAALGLGVMAPVIGRVIYPALMGVVGVIGMAVNFVLLGLVYFVVFTGTALALRLFSKDLLDRRRFRDAAGTSAWRRRPPPAPKTQYRHLS